MPCRLSINVQASCYLLFSTALIIENCVLQQFGVYVNETALFSLISAGIMHWFYVGAWAVVEESVIILWLDKYFGCQIKVNILCHLPVAVASVLLTRLFSCCFAVCFKLICDHMNNKLIQKLINCHYLTFMLIFHGCGSQFHPCHKWQCHCGIARAAEAS